MWEKIKAAPAISAGIITFRFLSYKLLSMKKLKIELDNSLDSCETLQEIIPKKNAALQTVRQQISAKLKAYFLECQPINAKEVRTKIDIAAAEKKSFHDAFQKIFRDAGTSFQSFAVDRETSAAYKAFRVSPRISRPKQPAPIPEPQESVRPEQSASKTLLTGEPEPSTEEQPESPDKHNHQQVAINEGTAAK